MSEINTKAVRKVGVTGANGHLGNVLVRLLLEEGYEVNALVYNNANALHGLDVKIFKGDVCDFESLWPFCKNMDAVIHCAGFISLSAFDKQKLHEVNVFGTQNVVQACLQSGVGKVVYVSSVQSFRCAKNQILDETAPRVSAVGDAYSYSKYLGELEIKKGTARGLNACIVNPTSILGPFDFIRGAQTRAILKIANGSVPALMKGGFDWVDVRDVSSGIIGAMNHGKCGSAYILSGHWKSFKEIAEHIASWANQKPVSVYFSLRIVGVVAFFTDVWAAMGGKQALFTQQAITHIKNGPSKVSHQLASAHFLYEPRPFKETIIATLEWLDGQNWIKEKTKKSK